MGLAAALLRQGRTPIEAAETSGVPFALVEWIAEDPRPRASSRSGVSNLATGDSGADGSPVGASAFSVVLLRARWRARAIASVIVGWLLACGLVATALTGRHPMSAAGAVVAIALMVVVTMTTTAVWSRPPAGGSDRWP